MIKSKITILDGGMGRELKRMGAPFKQPEWSALALIEAPDTVTQAHQSFIDAGAQVITTNAYALVPFHIGQERFDKDGRALIQLAGQLAQNIAQKHDVQVAGCLPPAFGSYRPDLFDGSKAKEIYTPLIEEQEPYIDFWLAETMSSIAEAQFLAQLVKQKSNKPLWISYSLTDRQGDSIEPQLRAGDNIISAAQAAQDNGAEALLFNCSQVEEMTPALKILQEMALSIPYGAYANSFAPIDGTKRANGDLTDIREEMTPDHYAQFAQEWVNHGATLIGGCCGITPEHIKCLSETI